MPKILVYGDSNTWGWRAVPEGFPADRFDDETRWAGVMATALGSGYRVSVDGLTVRSTDLDDPLDWNLITGAQFNGKATLAAAIAREMPLDLVIIMLGTNDLKAEYGRSAADIAGALGGLAELVASSQGGVAYTYGAPKCMLVAPPPMNTLPHPAFAEMFKGGAEKSRLLGAALSRVAAKAGAAYFDASGVVPVVEGVDGLHMSETQHRDLGLAMAKAVQHLQWS